MPNQRQGFDWVRVFVLLTVLSGLNACTAPTKATDLKADRKPQSQFWNGHVDVEGSDEASFTQTPVGPATFDERTYDTIIIGGGLAGLSSAVYLTDHKKSILLLEKESHFGGLAAGGETASNARYDRGAAYWTRAYDEELQILTHIKLKSYERKDRIYDPIDSYLWNGVLYKDVWEDEALSHLPTSFRVFKFQLQYADHKALIPNQPFEEYENRGGSLELDDRTAQEWIEGMPMTLSANIEALRKEIETQKDSQKKEAWTALLERGEEALAAWNASIHTHRMKGPTGMQDVIDFLTLYSRSALGSTPDTVSAVAFANFYISEVEPRYTTPIGTGQAAFNMEKILRGKDRKKNAKLEDRATVFSIKQNPEGVEVYYLKDGRTFAARAKYAVYAGQLKYAPKLIDGFAAAAPEQAELMSNLGYSHYSVHVIETEGHPYRGTYDTWVRAKDATSDDFTDVILGLWMDKRIKGYKGMRDFSKEPAIRDGVITLYQPLSQKWITSGYTDDQARALATYSVNRFAQIFSSLPKSEWQGPLKIKSVTTNKWPFSVHIAEKGHYKHKAKIMRQPFKRIFFANNNLGTPAFEEALFRGHCAANNILARMQQQFKNESWSNCPIDPVEKPTSLAEKK